MRKLANIFILLFLWASPCWAATYYIDYDAANDLGDGSISTPYKYVHGDSAVTPNMAAPTAGDTIYFKKGVTYRGQIDLAHNGSRLVQGTTGTITACAASGSCVLTDTGGNFTVLGVAANDLVYVYNSSTTGAWVNTVGLYQVVSKDSATQLTVTNLSTLAKPAYAVADMTYWVIRPVTYTSTASFGTGDAIITGIVDADAATCTNPCSTAVGQAPNSHTTIFKTNANYQRVTGLKIQGNAHPSGFDVPVNEATKCTDAGAPVCGEELVDGIKVTWQGAFYGPSGTTGFIIDNCTFDKVSNATALNASSSYTVLLANTFTNIYGFAMAHGGGYSLFEKNNINGAATGLNLSQISYTVIRSNVFLNMNISNCLTHQNAIRLTGMTYSWLIGNYIYNATEGIYITESYANTTNWIINNVFVGMYVDTTNANNCTWQGDFAIHAPRAPYTRVYNNTIFGPADKVGWSKSIMLGDESASGYTSGNSEIVNNLIYTPGAAQATFGTWDATTTASLISYNNVVYVPAAVNSKPFYISGAYKTWAEWQAAGFDVSPNAGSILQPLLIDVTGTLYTDFDLRLQTGDTVARTTGTTPLLLYDYNYIARTSLYSVGAYEQDGVVTSTGILTGNLQ